MTEITEKAELIEHYAQLPLNSEYLRVIAHDVRNRMNTIMMATDILNEELKDADSNPQKYIGMIINASQNILVILEAAVLAAEGKNKQE